VPHGTLQTLHVSAVFGVGEGRHVQGLRHHHRPFRVADPLTPQVLPLKIALRHPSPLPPIPHLYLALDSPLDGLGVLGILPEAPVARSHALQNVENALGLFFTDLVLLQKLADLLLIVHGDVDFFQF
jgi:hypothetical protein